MADNTPGPVDPKEYENAKEMWQGFTKLTKWGIYAVAGLLLLLALIFVDLF